MPGYWPLHIMWNARNYSKIKFAFVGHFKNLLLADETKEATVSERQSPSRKLTDILHPRILPTSYTQAHKTWQKNDLFIGDYLISASTKVSSGLRSYPSIIFPSFSRCTTPEEVTLRLIPYCLAVNVRSCSQQHLIAGPFSIRTAPNVRSLRKSTGGMGRRYPFSVTPPWRSDSYGFGNLAKGSRLSCIWRSCVIVSDAKSKDSQNWRKISRD